MRFRIRFTQEAEDQFLKLPKDIQSLMQRAMKDRLETNPLSYGKPLKHSWKGHRSLRVSNYRILYRVDQQEVTVTIVKTDIRRDVYES